MCVLRAASAKKVCVLRAAIAENKKLSIAEKGVCCYSTHGFTHVGIWKLKYIDFRGIIYIYWVSTLQCSQFLSKTSIFGEMLSDECSFLR